MTGKIEKISAYTETQHAFRLLILLDSFGSNMLCNEKLPATFIELMDFSELPKNWENIHKEYDSLLLFCKRKTIQEYLEPLKNIALKQSFLPVKIISFLIDEKDDFSSNILATLPVEWLYLTLPTAIGKKSCVELLNTASHFLQMQFEKNFFQSQLKLSLQEMDNILSVGQAMATEKNFEYLISFILEQAREMVSADGGSIYVVERKRGGEKPTHIRFKKSALLLQANEFLLPIDKNSLAGYCALTGEPMLIEDVHNIPAESEYHFNDDFDRTHGYHTRSMMLVPMKNHRDEVIGVIQLINRKKDFKKKLTLEEMKGEDVISFRHKDMVLISALAGQSAVSIQNNQLLQDINNLFEGFVKAAVTAIEQRDPATSGHSFRVATLTTRLAEAVNKVNSGRLAEYYFDTEQIRELRYASLLHDFGKVGVRENVLVKAKKLSTEEMEAIKWRINNLYKDTENKFLKKKIAFLQTQGKDGFEEFARHLENEWHNFQHEIFEMKELIKACNEPTIMESGNFEKLTSIASIKVNLSEGNETSILNEKELINLSVKKGNLNPDERQMIESHALHTYSFLIQIPWTEDLLGVPNIARSHHEKIQGGGYPDNIKGDSISLQSRMIAIADIFDALTVMDRPYKKALPVEKALSILQEEAEHGNLDEELLQIFINEQIYSNL